MVLRITKKKEGLREETDNEFGFVPFQYRIV